MSNSDETVHVPRGGPPGAQVPAGLAPPPGPPQRGGVSPLLIGGIVAAVLAVIVVAVVLSTGGDDNPSPQDLAAESPTAEAAPTEVPGAEPDPTEVPESEAPEPTAAPPEDRSTSWRAQLFKCSCCWMVKLCVPAAGPFSTLTERS